jgi:hypothetical protein
MPLQLDIFHLMKLHRAGGLRLIFYLISDAACIGMVKLQLSEPNFRGDSQRPRPWYLTCFCLYALVLICIFH